MSRIGLVLGGGGVTGAAFHFGTLLALEMATGWDPNDAEVIVGTSSGAVVGSIVRSGGLSLDALLGDGERGAELSGSLGDALYRRTLPTGVWRWLRHGLVPGIRRPGLQLTVASPALYTTGGLAEWLEKRIGDDAHGWPDRPTIVTAYEVEGRRRVAFGTDDSPDTSLVRAVTASSAIPMVFAPVTIDGRRYVDGGLASGTNSDLVLGADPPLDLVIVIAPMASLESRPGARFYEGILDRLGTTALGVELAEIEEAWPGTDVLTLRPDAGVLQAARPNPLATGATFPAFVQTLHSMRDELARPEVWPFLERHLLNARRTAPSDDR
jgi:NTE family protein